MSNDERFHYVACGLSNVWLVNGVTKRATQEGGSFHIDQINELHKAIGMSLIEQASPLRPDEFRFLRTEVGLSRRNLGTVLGVSAETIKKWESAENPIQKASDAWLRNLYLSHIHHDEIRDLIKQINLGEKLEKEICLSKTPQGWAQENCA